MSAKTKKPCYLVNETDIRRVEEEPDIGYGNHRQNGRCKKSHRTRERNRMARLTNRAITMARVMDVGIVPMANQALLERIFQKIGSSSFRNLLKLQNEMAGLPFLLKTGCR